MEKKEPKKKKGMNLPNKITLTRIFMIPVFVAFFFLSYNAIPIHDPNPIVINLSGEDTIALSAIPTLTSFF